MIEAHNLCAPIEIDFNAPVSEGNEQLQNLPFFTLHPMEWLKWVIRTLQFVSFPVDSKKGKMFLYKVGLAPPLIPKDGFQNEWSFYHHPKPRPPTWRTAAAADADIPSSSCLFDVSTYHCRFRHRPTETRQPTHGVWRCHSIHSMVPQRVGCLAPSQNLLMVLAVSALCVLDWEVAWVFASLTRSHRRQTAHLLSAISRQRIPFLILM